MSEAVADLYPAIDLRAGRAVRLTQGDYSREVRYGDDPVAIAIDFAQQGARWIHVVDLDAARTGDPVNRPVVGAIVRAVGPGVSVQTGGGVRSAADAKVLADLGVTRAVMGSSAVRDPDSVVDASEHLAIAVGLDHRNGDIAVHGWTEGTGQRLEDLMHRYPAAACFVITDIARDGMLEGPDLNGLAMAAAQAPVGVIASGGVATLIDVEQLARIPGIVGVITGKALYERRFSVAEALSTISLAAGTEPRP